MRTQAILLLPPIPALEDLRRSLDPQMAARIPPHVTAIYDDEAPAPDLMIHRLRDVCGGLLAIQLELREIVSFEPPSEGLYVVTTASASFAELRAQVLRPPFAPRNASMWPHVTILHPRSVATSAADWRSYIGSEIGRSTLVREIKVMEYDGSSWHIRASIPLSDRSN